MTNLLPLIPEWQELHPLVVHFPIAFLLLAPVFLVIGVFRPSQSGAFLVSSLATMVLGTLGSIVALQTGKAARVPVPASREIAELIERHRGLADSTCVTFCALTAVFAIVVVLPRLMSISSSRVVTVILPAVFLLLYSGGAALLVNTARVGGTLVHEFGITASQTHESGQETGILALDKAQN